MRLFGESFVFGLLAVLSLPSLATANPAPEPVPAILEARGATWVQSFERCSTQYCYPKPRTISKTTKYVQLKTTTVVTSKKYQKTRWVVNPKSTKTIYVTKQPTTTSTHSTVYVTRYSTTVRTLNERKVDTITEYTSATGVTTITSTAPAVTIPAPRGFVPVLADPANADVPYTFTWGKKHKRDAMPEPTPEPEPAQGYPKARFCTKTFKTHYTVTTVKTIASTTITGPAKTTTKTIYKGTTKTVHITPKGARTSYTTRTVSSTSVTTWSWTFTTTLGSYSSTETIAKPAPTLLGACLKENQAPPPLTSFNTDGWHVVISDPIIGSPRYDRFLTNGTAYDCCEACHKLPASGGVCLGSYWEYRGFWGEPPCADPSVPQGPWCDEPKDRAECTLIIRTGNTCGSSGFKATSGFDVPRILSNGPTCPYFKYQGTDGL